jgi:hypothetical protein
VGRAVAGEDGREDLLERFVDRPDDRHPPEHDLAQLNQRAPHQIGGEKPKQGQPDEADDQTEAGNLDRQIGFGPVGDRDERRHQAVDPFYERPGQVGGDRNRAGDDEAGEKTVADAVGDA